MAVAGRIEDHCIIALAAAQLAKQNDLPDRAINTADKTTQKWGKLTEPMQEPLDTRKPGEWWASMEEVFHTD